MTATFVTRFSLFTSTPAITFNSESLNLKDKENKQQKKKLKIIVMIITIVMKRNCDAMQALYNCMWISPRRKANSFYEPICISDWLVF